jgi:endonuclease YncB( thermonuclease family)
MKTKPLTFLLVLIFLISGSTTVSAKPRFGDYEGAIYVRNYDGDTITFNLPNLHPIIGKKIAIRVNGIDTPEIRGKCDKEKYDAKQAKGMVEEFLKDAERIDLKNMGRGKYFRIVADVYADGENLAEALVDSGMAVKYDGGKKNARWCE